MAEFDPNRKDKWFWTMRIMQPEGVIAEYFHKAKQEIERKKNFTNLELVQLGRFEEGLAAQQMYMGPYSAEGPTIIKIHDFIKSQAYKLSGKHHEIYLSDPRRVAPEKMKTIIRQPMAKQ
jgi:hypothetical protein